MAHMVIYRTVEGKPAYHQATELEDAISYVERLRNDEGIEHARIFDMKEVPFEFRLTYRVEIASGGQVGVPDSPGPLGESESVPSPTTPAGVADPTKVPDPSEPYGRGKVPDPSDTSEGSDDSESSDSNEGRRTGLFSKS